MMDFVIEGHRVSFERNAGDAEFRILVDGAAVPMKLTETETYVGNTGSVTRELASSRTVTWIPTKGCPAETRIEILGPRKAYFGFPLEITHAYNTSIWRYHSAKLAFADDYSSVDIHWDYSVDTST
jgi:hypothetical protein